MIFSRKESIKSLLKNATDIHNHILPGIDDGSPNIETSIDLVLKYIKLGFTKIIATPHTMGDYYPNTSKTILDTLLNLKNELKEKEISGIDIKASSEYMIDVEFEEIIENPSNLLPLANKHILIEMSYLGESQNLEEILFKLQLKDYQPILAHPERYSFYLSDNEQYYILKSKGVKFQLNLLSLTGHYGGKIKEIAIKLLKEDMYDYVGIDTHRMEHLNKVEKMKVPKKLIPKLEKLFENNESLF